MTTKELKRKQTWINVLFLIEVGLFYSSGFMASINIILASIIFTLGVFLAVYVGKKIGEIEVEKYKNEYH